MADTPSLEQHSLVTATIDGVPAGVWDKFDGGEIDSEAKTYREGGQIVATVIPGTPSVSDVTIGRIYRGERDAPFLAYVKNKVGRPIVIAVQALTSAYTPVPGGLETYTGVVKGRKRPTVDSNGNGEAMLEVTATVAMPT